MCCLYIAERGRIVRAVGDTYTREGQEMIRTVRTTLVIETRINTEGEGVPTALVTFTDEQLQNFIDYSTPRIISELVEKVTAGGKWATVEVLEPANV